MFLSLVRQENLDQQQRKPSTLSQASPCSKPILGYLFPAIFSLVTQDMIKGDGFPPRNFIQLKRKHYRLWLKPKFTQPFEFQTLPLFLPFFYPAAIVPSLVFPCSCSKMLTPTRCHSLEQRQNALAPGQSLPSSTSAGRGAQIRHLATATRHRGSPTAGHSSSEARSSPALGSLIRRS